MNRGLQLRFEDPAAFRAEYERNIVQGGAFVPTTERFELRSTALVELELAWCGETVRLEAEIVHCTPQGTDPRHAGVAVQFLADADRLRERLGPIAAAAPAIRAAAPGALEEAPPEGPAAGTAPEPEALEIGSFDDDETVLELDEPSEAQPERGHFELEASHEPEADARARAAAEPDALEFDEAQAEPLDLDETPGAEPDLLELDEPAREAAAASPLDGSADEAPLVLELEDETSPGLADPLAPEASGPTDPDPLEGVVERRAAERLTARLPARVDADHISLDGRTRDISENGVLLSADGNDLPIGKRVTLALSHPQTGERLTIEGTVARHIASGGTVGAVGIAFDAGLDGDEHLRSFIREVQAAERARREAGISGVIEELGMANLLQMFGKSSPRGTLTVSSGAEEGVVAFEDGDLRYVRLGGLRGVKALTRLLGWEYGAFEFVSHVDPFPDEEDPLPLEGALLEAMRQLDEASRDGAGALDPGAILRLDRNALTTLDKPLAQVEEAVLDLAAAGLSVRRLLDVIPESDAEIVGALHGLLDRGLVALDPPKN